MKKISTIIVQNSFKTLSLLALVFLFALSSCGKKCKNENPRAKVTNNGTTPVSVQIKTSGGNTENINNIDPGMSSANTSYAPGEVIFTIVVNKINYMDTVAVANCFDYNIAIDGNNNISTTAIDRNE